MYAVVVELLFDDRMEQRVQQRDVAARLESEPMRGVAHQILAARIDDDQLRAALRRLLEERGRDRMIHGRPSADDDDALRVHRGVERRGHGARADAFHERRDGRRVAEPRAVIDVVGFEARAHELLEQVGLLVRALRRAEARQRLAAALVENLLEPLGRARQRLFPRGFAEDLEAVSVRFGAVHIARRVVAADERLREALRRSDIVVAEAAFDAEPVLVRVTVAAVDLHDAVVFDRH